MTNTSCLQTYRAKCGQVGGESEGTRLENLATDCGGTLDRGKGRGGSEECLVFNQQVQASSPVDESSNSGTDVGSGTCGGPHVIPTSLCAAYISYSCPMVSAGDCRHVMFTGAYRHLVPTSNGCP